MPILIIMCILLVYGLLALLSVSVHESFTTTLMLVSKGKLLEPTNYFYFFRQLQYVVLALCIGRGVTKFPFGWLKKPGIFRGIIGAVAIVQLLVFTPLGDTLNGASGWLNIPGMPSIQPVEFFKIGYVLFMAGWLIRKKQYIDDMSFIGMFVVVQVVICGVLLAIPDLGSILIIALTGLVMCFAIGVRPKVLYTIVGGGCLGLMLALQVLFAMTSSCPQLILTTDKPQGICKLRYVANRFTYFLSDTTNLRDRRGIGRQNEQAMIAIGGGGFRGNGYGKGLQKFGYISEAQSDFIFASYAEETGFVGSVVLLGLYGALAYACFRAIQGVRDPFFRLICIGWCSLLFIQAFVNIGVNIKILPNTGLTLPLISSGGTSLLVMVSALCAIYTLSTNRFV